MNGTFHIPQAINEPIYEYASGSNERKLLQAALKDARSKVEDIPMYIGAEEVRTGDVHDLFPPMIAITKLVNITEVPPAMFNKPLMLPWPQSPCGSQCLGNSAPRYS